MNTEVKKALLKDWVDPEDEKYLDGAIEEINKGKRKELGVPRDFDITQPQQTKKWDYVFDFDNDEHTIKELQEALEDCKDDGYEYVEFDPDYDDLIAYKWVAETPEECAKRIRIDVLQAVNYVKRRHSTREQKLDKIIKLEKQIEKLKEELKEYETLRH